MSGGGRQSDPSFHELPPELRGRLFRATFAMWFWLILTFLLFFLVSNFAEFLVGGSYFRPIHFAVGGVSLVGGAGAHFGVFHARIPTRLRFSLPTIGGLLPVLVLGTWAAARNLAWG